MSIIVNFAHLHEDYTLRSKIYRLILRKDRKSPDAKETIKGEVNNRSK